MRLLAGPLLIAVFISSAGAGELTAEQLAAAEKLIDEKAQRPRAPDLRALIERMSSRHRGWLASAVERYGADRDVETARIGSLRTDFPDGRWAWQVVAGGKALTIAVKRSGRAAVTLRKLSADGKVPPPFTMSQAALIQQVPAGQPINISQSGDVVRNLHMGGVSIPQWNAFGAPSTRADFRVASRPTSPRKTGSR